MAVPPLFSVLGPKAGILPERLWRPNVPLTESFTIVFVAFAIVGLAIGILAWPALGRTLLAYGLAARIPVALLMLVAMLGNWGTHYDARPSYPQMSTLGWWVAIGLAPHAIIVLGRPARAAGVSKSRLTGRARESVRQPLVTAWSPNTRTYGASPCCPKAVDSLGFNTLRAGTCCC